ncbi:hypothetical protein L1887_12382 [Cichorium endivia]|nr:hypothetical protein L1887_12382 [Cichorium endivia]
MRNREKVSNGTYSIVYSPVTFQSNQQNGVREIVSLGISIPNVCEIISSDLGKKILKLQYWSSKLQQTSTFCPETETFANFGEILSDFSFELLKFQPEDWDDEEDGEWTLPTIINKFF